MRNLIRETIDPYEEIRNSHTNEHVLQQAVRFFELLNDNSEPYSLIWYYHLRRLAEICEPWIDRVHGIGSVLDGRTERIYGCGWGTLDDVDLAAAGVFIIYVYLDKGDPDYTFDLMSDLQYMIDSEIPSLDALMADPYLSKSGESNIQKAFETVTEAKQRQSNNNFIQIKFAEVVITAFEYDISIYSPSGMEPEKDSLIELVEKPINELIDSPSPSIPLLFELKGRLLLQNGKPAEAANEFENALDIMDINRGKKKKQISKLQRLKLDAKIEERTMLFDNNFQELDDRSNQLSDDLGGLEDSLENTEQDINSLRGQTLQFLGFFAALISLIIASVTISTQLEFSEAAGLILILTGGLIITIWSLSRYVLMDLSNLSDDTYIELILIGSTLIIIGLSVPFIL